jgi:NAD(P)-dependent dehydrogenase (short-subunit alcohol dehydrogenase family)
MIATGFLSQGAKVYISARKPDACRQAASELSSLGPCIALPQDISSVEGARALALAYGKHENGLDILVNNAGTNWGAPFDEYPESGWDKVANLNLKGPFFLTQALAGHLRHAAITRPAKVINIASIDGVRNNPRENYSYAANKAALIHMTRRMALRLIEDNVVVTAIAPRTFASEMTRAAHGDTEQARADIPARRLGRDEDMAGAAIYLASNAGDYVVGATLIVDGGVTQASP